MSSDVLLIIDMQNAVYRYANQESENLAECIAIIRSRIETYRSLRKPIIFIQHQDEQLIPDSYDWQLISALDCQPSDDIIHKTHPNAFYNTELKNRLGALQARSIEICGAPTEYCVDATVKVSHGLGYDVTMYRHATTTYDNDFMTGKDTIAFYERMWDKRYATLIKA